MLSAGFVSVVATTFTVEVFAVEFFTFTYAFENWFNHSFIIFTSTFSPLCKLERRCFSTPRTSTISHSLSDFHTFIKTFIHVGRYLSCLLLWS